MTTTVTSTESQRERVSGEVAVDGTEVDCPQRDGDGVGSPGV